MGECFSEILTRVFMLSSCLIFTVIGKSKTHEDTKYCNSKSSKPKTLQQIQRGGGFGGEDRFIFYFYCFYVIFIIFILLCACLCQQHINAKCIKNCTIRIIIIIRNSF